MMMQAMQLMGQAGMVRGSGVERNYRDARWSTQLDEHHEDDDEINIVNQTQPKVWHTQAKISMDAFI